MGKSINITTPVARLIGGDLYTPETKDYDGKPLTMKDKITPRVDFSFGVAIPKTPGVTHWANEAWGGPIWALGNEAFTNGETQRPDFAWKITDGDSQIPNKRGRKPADREGYPGHWVIWFSGGYAPTIYNANGTEKILEKDAVKPGYYVQVFGNITDNKPSQSPGMYINHTYVAYAAYGPEIVVGPDVSAAGFGVGAVLPPGATLAPVVGAFNVAAPPVPGVPVVVPNIPVVPNPAILNVPVVPAPPAAPVKNLTALAQGATYEQLLAKGWTDALLIQNGMMLA